MWASCPFDNVFRKLICLPKIFLERKDTNLKWKYTSKNVKTALHFTMVMRKKFGLFNISFMLHA